MTERKIGAMTRVEAAARARAVRMANIPPLQERFWSKVDKRGLDECWPWKAAVRRKDEGYGAFWLEGRHQPASKVAWRLTHGQIADGLEVCHRCDNPQCCNPGHLFLGARQDNNADKVAKGRQARGSMQPRAVLTEDLVIELRRLAKLVGLKKAAQQIGVNEATAGDACYRRWRHVR